MTAANSLGPKPLPRLRSLLFAPAIRDDLIPKMPGTGADGVVIDCEDATPVSQKAAGRSNAVELAPTIMDDDRAVFTRVNAPGTQWFREDIEFGLHENLAGVFVPMVESLDQLDQVAKALAAADFGHLGIVAGLETALGVADARYLLGHGQVVGAYFGSEDYVADLGPASRSSTRSLPTSATTTACPRSLWKPGRLALPASYAFTRSRCCLRMQDSNRATLRWSGLSACWPPMTLPLPAGSQRSTSKV